MKYLYLHQIKGKNTVMKYSDEISEGSDLSCGHYNGLLCNRKLFFY